MAKVKIVRVDNEFKGGDISYYRTGEGDYDNYPARHRVDGPAYIGPGGSEMWMQGGVRHRLDGPAHIYPGGTEEYWIEGKRYDRDKFLEYVEQYGLG